MSREQAYSVAVPAFLALVLLAAVLLWAWPALAASTPSQCVACHQNVTPDLVKDWQAGKMAAAGLDCSTCHGTKHQSASDYKLATMPTAATCAACHEKQVKQFQSGKHAAAWVAMEAMPKTAHQPKQLIDGEKGCGGCHSIGRNGGQCDSCHTRHRFSAAEARQPYACQTCHMGFDHPQWEMWSTSKHGSAYFSGGTDRAPTCQTCHMPDGDHGVLTSWGFLAVRLPEKDPAWLADRVTILKALGVLDPQGNPTARLEVVKAGNVARLTEEAWQAPREKMLATCSRCHSRDFASAQLAAGDAVVREADRLMAEAINTVASLYRDGILKKPADYAYPYPDLLTFYDAPTPIEQKLYEMFLEYRMRTFQGAFHFNPDYMHWYGWAPMKTALVEIKEEAERLRAAKGQAAAVPARAGSQSYTVRPGDTLAKIAARLLGNPERWPDIYAANRNKLRSPHLILPGTVLVIP